MSHNGKIRTEHAGAKNGGGYWGTREEAKEHSDRLRRARDKAESVHDPEDLEPCANGTCPECSGNPFTDDPQNPSEPR